MIDTIPYEVLKMIHILSAFLLFGTGLGTAFFGLMASLRGEAVFIAQTFRHVVLADWVFTTPSVILQPLTGWLLMQQLGIGFDEPWIVMTFMLYVITGLCWLPVVWLQLQMRDIAIERSNQDLQGNTELPKLYYRYAKIWFVLGWPAFTSVMIIIWLMIAKPVLWG